MRLAFFVLLILFLLHFVSGESSSAAPTNHAVFLPVVYREISENGTQPLALIAHSTIESMGVVSPYLRDKNLNNVATAYYRPVGSTTWAQVHPMSADRSSQQWRVSLFYLSPNTEYQIEVRYQDPDGVSKTVVSTQVKTRPDYPNVGSTGTIRTVPTDGTLQNVLDSARPGDTIQLLSGVYPGNVSLSASQSGRPGQYITIEPASGATVIFDGSDTDVNGSGDNWIFYGNSDNGAIYYTDLPWGSTVCGDSTLLPNYVGELVGQKGVRYLLFDSGTQSWDSDFLPAPVGKAYYVCNSAGPGPIGRLYVVTYSGDDPDNHQMHLGRYQRAFLLNGASYIRIRGFEFRYYSLSGVQLKEQGTSSADHNIIEDNVFHGIGEAPVRLTGKPGADFVANNLVQNNVFYEHGYRDSRWQWEVEYHHGGAATTGVFLYQVGPGNVVRGNHFTSGHDAISVKEGTRDADIYDNTISECMDNGIEVDEVGEVDDDPIQNVRVWGNTIKYCYSSISLQNWEGTNEGPVYIFRNAIIGGDDPLGRTDDLGGTKGYNTSDAFKLGSDAPYIGQAFIYHNTVSIHRSTLGSGYGLNDSGGDYFAGAVSRNNIFNVTADPINLAKATTIISHDFDCDNLHDLDPSSNTMIRWGSTGGPSNDGRYKTLAQFQAHTGQELNGISNTGTLFDADLHLLPGSPDIDAGCVITGINDRGPYAYTGAAPDLGAFEYKP